MKERFKVEPVHLTPIIASLLFSILCAYLISVSPIEHYNVTPLPEGVPGSFGNAFYFVVLVGIGATIIYFLIRRGSQKLMLFLIGLAITMAVFLLSFLYSFAFLASFNVFSCGFFALIVSVLITVLADVAIFKLHGWVSSLVVLLLGGALGAFLGASIPTLSTVLILCFLAVYDVFAVYRGPVGKIADKGLEKLHGLSFSFKDVQMGLGDLTFYSMLTGHMFLFFGYLPCLASIIGILAGCFFAFKMLEKRGIFPGLPFPIILGLTLGFLTSFMIKFL